jgi:hypothetical protein
LFQDFDELEVEEIGTDAVRGVACDCDGCKDWKERKKGMWFHLEWKVGSRMTDGDRPLLDHSVE